MLQAALKQLDGLTVIPRAASPRFEAAAHQQNTEVGVRHSWRSTAGVWWWWQELGGDTTIATAPASPPKAPPLFWYLGAKKKKIIQV